MCLSVMLVTPLPRKPCGFYCVISRSMMALRRSEGSVTEKGWFFSCTNHPVRQEQRWGPRARHTGGNVMPRVGRDSPAASCWPQSWVFTVTAHLFCVQRRQESQVRAGFPVKSQLCHSALFPEQALTSSPCLSFLSYMVGTAQSGCDSYKGNEHRRP